jgi:alanyl-tRNA synthetase
MVQFKDYFLGLREPPSRSLATVQKCLRAGGKHNDLDNVGYTARHQTFFEMLGNFSFGSYWKREAIEYAWTFLTKEIGLPEHRLSATVLHGDEETADIWRSVIGLSGDRLRYCGPEDNFWSMGEGRGPCGPCTEIFFDQGKLIDGEQYLEIWNLVFMQFEKGEDGSQLGPLPTKCIDTGMGLERLASVIQGVASNWETDNLAFLIESTHNLLRGHITARLSSGEEQIAMRVVVDHLRAACFLIAEGLTPGPQGRSYILRRILRRAIRYLHRLGVRSPVLSQLVRSVVDSMGEAYPELIAAQQHIERVLLQEETLFLATISRALDLLKSEFSSGSSGTVSGDTAWNLYFHLGFPLDLTEVVAKEHGWHVDIEGFNAHLEKTRQLSRENWKGSGDHTIPSIVRSWTVKPKFVGYDSLESQSTILAASIDPTSKNDAWICIDPCPFYAEGGGQIGDRGILSSLSHPVLTLPVLDTISPYSGGIALKVRLPDSFDEAAFQTYFDVRSTVNASVDVTMRLNTRRNHTATHLLHSALRKTLGYHVAQAGSLVDPNRLRFDFTHNAPLTQEEISAVEAVVNDAIQKSIPVASGEMDYKTAVEHKGAMALFGDKYDSLQQVRVIEVPSVSVELCGGTHANDTAQLMLFKIVSQQAIGAGTRRIEALTGPAALEHLMASHRTLTAAASALRTDDLHHIPIKLKEILDRQRSQDKLIKQLQTEALRSSSPSEKILSGKWGEFKLNLISFPPSTDASVLRQKADDFRVAESDAVHLFVCSDRLLLTCGNSHSGKLLQSLSTQLGSICKGGGGPTIAEGKLFVAADAFVEALKSAKLL